MTGKKLNRKKKPAGEHARRESCGCQAYETAEGPQKRGGRPDGSVRADVRDPLKVAGAGWPLGEATEYGVLEGLRGLLAAGAGGWCVVAPRGVSTEVALARPHLV